MTGTRWLLDYVYLKVVSDSLIDFESRLDICFTVMSLQGYSSICTPNWEGNVEVKSSLPYFQGSLRHQHAKALPCSDD
jgi:hypothetical protein